MAIYNRLEVNFLLVSSPPHLFHFNLWLLDYQASVLYDSG